DDLAFLQYTSGSTADPRGVMVTHRSLLSNIECFMDRGLQMDPDRDVGVTWLPLYHDMGLVGFVLGPICRAISVIFIPTIRLVNNASVWMDSVHRHRGTVTFAPNFAFARATRRARAVDLDRWDLSCLKAVGCGAEPIRPRTLREFAHVFGERCRLSPRAILPAYGLAEATLAVSMTRVGDQMRTRLVDRGRFHAEGVAEPAPDGAVAEEHVACGVPFPGHEVRIIGELGEPQPDGVQGEIVVRGPSITHGYFGDPIGSEMTWREGWLYT